MLRTLSFAVALFVASRVDVFAAAGGEHGFNWAELAWRSFNFVALVFLIVYFGGKHIRAYFAGRTEKIEGALRDSEAAIVDAKKALAEVDERVKNREVEVREILAAARETGDMEKARLIAEGEKAADVILKQAQARIELDVKKAKDALRAEAAALAVQMAEEIIQKGMKDADHREAVNDSLARVGGG